MGPSDLSMVREIVAGEVRAAQRSIDALRADLILHETGHDGARLPDVVRWAYRQWGQVPHTVKVYIYVYALGALVMFIKWAYRNAFTNGDTTAPYDNPWRVQ